MSKQSEFIESVAGYAMRSGIKWGIPPSLAIAQTILETGWGDHVPHNNYFGIKGKGPEGSANLTTSEVMGGAVIHITDKFRKYASPQQSFDDHNRMLAESTFYANTRAAAPDSAAMGHTLTGVYATDPEYGKKLEQIITKYRLTKFDPVEKPRPVKKPKPVWVEILGLVFERCRDIWIEYKGGRPRK